VVSVSDALNVRHSESARFIDHVAIAVADADAASRWYIERLGMRVAYDEAVTAAGVRLMYLAGAAADGPQTMLQLVQPFGPGAVDTFLRERGEGLHHVCFAVAAIGATLAAAGDPGLGEFAGGRGRRACFLAAAPNNVNVELTEVEPSSAPLPWSEHAGRAAS
jgi:methylmalonyl-CoA/ethylmalonyl-CoA epimerase